LASIGSIRCTVPARRPSRLRLRTAKPTIVQPFVIYRSCIVKSSVHISQHHNHFHSEIPMQRRRRGTSHSKSGCESCRRRQLKCDEQKPQCLRCMRDGATCERDSLNLYRPSQQSAPDSLGITTYSPPFCVPGTPGERKALHYLSTYGASDIGGWLGADFWNRRSYDLQPHFEHLT
jgi:hypothetical protein